ncbi:tetratricopeptide repeat protein [Candidatus Bipolaricaulota bacterium]
MSVDLLSSYVAIDRRHAITQGEELGDRSNASILLADISGFTPLTEALVEGLGPRRGAEELTALLNTVYTTLVTRVHHFGGSVVCFIGDALIGFFDQDSGLRALACGLQMQRAMKEYQTVSVPQGGVVRLAMKAAVEAGSVRRFLVGDPEIRRMDVLAGATVDRLADAEHVAERGEVIAAPSVARRLGRDLVIDEWRGRFGVVAGLREPPRPEPWSELAADAIANESLRPYVLKEVYDRVVAGHGSFLSELRPVAALFLRFSGLDYDADDAAGEKLDAFTAWSQQVTHRYGGHVLMLTTADKGSHLYAAFGALEAHEDDAERAVAAAMELSRPPAELGFVEDLQIGVSQGRVRVGGYGGETRRTYGALGETVNLAARLMGAAPGGEVRCSEQIFAACRSRFAFDALPAVMLKGMSRAQPIYRPTGRERERSEADRRDLIGRRMEIDHLQRSLREACEGARRLLLIEGEAGIGKSRLVDELRLLASEAEATWLFGAASSIEQHTPYRAWRDVLLALFDIEESADPMEARKRVVEGVVAVNPAFEARVPLLNDVLGVDLEETDLTRSYDPQLRQEGLAALIGELLLCRAMNAPLVLVLDDAHWMDSLSWDLSLSVARTLSERPTLIVLTHRPLADPVPHPYVVLSDLKGAATLRLESLSAEETIALAAAQLGLSPAALPEEVSSLLTERAEGNPFFALELIGALLDRDLLVIDEGRCALAAEPEAIRESVPDTLEGVVLSRLDGLPAEAQLTVKVASVIGRSFLLRALHDVYPDGIEADALQAQLDETGKRRLTLLEAQDPEPSYAFQHVVTQQVAYDTLLFEQRRSLHRSVAGWIEGAHAENLNPHYPLLVFHWNRAGHGENEYRYCRLAGSQAVGQHANTEALVYFSRAVELIEGLDRDPLSARRYDALKSRAGISALLGRVEEERGDLKALRGIADGEEGPSWPGEVRLLWSDFHRRGGQFAEAVGEADSALATAKAANDSIGAARALTHIGSALEGQGQFQEARERVEEALNLFRAAEEFDGQAASLKTLGIVSARLGEFPRAMERFGEARELFRKLRNRKGEADILGNLGALSYYLGQYEECIQSTEEAQRTFHEMGNRIGSAKCLTNLGSAYSALGAFAEGLEHHQRALELYSQLEDLNGYADSLCNIGVTHATLGAGGQLEFVFQAREKGDEIRLASETTEEAMALYRRIGSHRGEAITSFNLGAIHLCVGDTSGAEAQLRHALGMAEESGLDRLIMRSLSALARTAFVAGNLEQAAELSNRAVDLLKSQTGPEALEIRFTQFRVLESRAQHDEALPHLEFSRSAVLEQAQKIADRGLRDRLLMTYGEVMTAWEKHKAASIG